MTNLNVSGVQGCPASPALPCAFHTLPPLRHGLAQGRLQDLSSLLSTKFPFQGDLRSMWSDPFVHVPPAKYQAIWDLSWSDLQLWYQDTKYQVPGLLIWSSLQLWYQDTKYQAIWDMIWPSLQHYYQDRGHLRYQDTKLFEEKGLVISSHVNQPQKAQTTIQVLSQIWS